MVTIARAEYRNKLHGAWLGKLVGAALGSPFDGRKQAQEVAAGPEALAGQEAHPLEGTDFQLVWIRALQEASATASGDDLLAAWLRHITYARGEYAYARSNFLRDLRPPVSGVFNNPFRESLGGLERADLWGLLAPADPGVAARNAYQDAALDHSGPGAEAAMAFAAMVSAAFVEDEMPRLLEVALAVLPKNSKVGRVLRDVARWHGELPNWRRTREMLLRSYGSEDVRDSAVALGTILLSLLDGAKDFGRALVTAASCGLSTSCTCSAVGAILGALLGRDAIPQPWREPIREELTAGWGVVGLPRAFPLATLAAHTAALGEAVVRSQCAGRVELADETPEEGGKLSAPEAPELLRRLSMGPYVASFRRGPLEIQVDYDACPTIGYDRPRPLAIALTNTSSRSLDLSARVSAPAGFVVATNSDQITLPAGATVSFNATISAPVEHAQVAAANPCTLVLAIEGEAALTAPITLVGEELWHAAGPYGDFDQAHSPEQPGVLSGETPLGGEGWQELSVPEPAVNLLAGFQGDRGTYYLAADIRAPRARRGRLRIGCNDGTKVWLNGQQIFYGHEHRPVSPASVDEFDASFREGANRVVIKMAQCSPRRFLSVAFLDVDGHVLVELVNTGMRRPS